MISFMVLSGISDRGYVVPGTLVDTKLSRDEILNAISDPAKKSVMGEVFDAKEALYTAVRAKDSAAVIKAKDRILTVSGDAEKLCPTDSYADSKKAVEAKFPTTVAFEAGPPAPTETFDPSEMPSEAPAPTTEQRPPLNKVVYSQSNAHLKFGQTITVPNYDGTAAFEITFTSLESADVNDVKKSLRGNDAKKVQKAYYARWTETNVGGDAYTSLTDHPTPLTTSDDVTTGSVYGDDDTCKDETVSTSETKKCEIWVVTSSGDITGGYYRVDTSTVKGVQPGTEYGWVK